MKTKILTGLFLLFSISLFAHPHVFINNSLEFIWSGKNLQGVHVRWDFDRFFSADIINWLDENKDGVFNKTETQQVYNRAFINLKNYYFYSFMRQGKKRTNPASVSQFVARQKDGILIYEFYIDLSSYKGGKLAFAMYDYTYYCDIQPAEHQPIKLTYDKTVVTPNYRIVDNEDYPVYYDPFSPATDSTVYNTWKKGLVTFFPQEIQLTW